MCFYNGINISRATHIKLNEIEKELGDMKEAMQRPLQSGFEFGNWPVLVSIGGGPDFRIEFMHWELIPSYVKDGAGLQHFRHGGPNPVTGRKDPPRNTLNAIGEEMLDKVSYKQAALKRRCLVLSSGFYEWRHFTPPGSKKDQAYPYHITVKGREYFFMAGIWQPWTDRETGETMDTFAIVTTAANTLMAQVHNRKKRMPLILPDELAAEWMRDGLSPSRITEICHYHFPPERMEAETIRKDFRTAADPLISEAYPELPALSSQF
jgi:putative SOS response-associated peptidase YedK